MSNAVGSLAGLTEEQYGRLVSFLEPIAPNQLRLWIDQELDLSSDAYNVSRLIRLRGSLDAEALRRAVDALTERHEILRTVFVEHADEVYQLVLDPQPVITEMVHAPAAGDEAELLRAAREFTLRPFDLRTEPPFRARLVRVSADEHVLELAFHHIGTDGWSLSIFERELAECYRAFAAGMSWPDGAEEPAQYGHFARRQRELLTPELVERQIGYWRKALPPGAPAAAMLGTPPFGSSHAGQTAITTLAVPPSAAAAIDDLTTRLDVSIFVVLQTAVQIVAQRYSGDPAVVLGTTTLNRKVPEFESALGFFVNTVALHTDLTDDPSFADALARARGTVGEALSHDDVPFDRVVTAIAAPSAPFRIAVELQDAADGGRDWGTVSAEPVSLEEKRAKFDLALFFLRAPHGLDLLVEYDTSRFDEMFVSSFARAVFTAVTEGARAPGTPVFELPLLDADARTALRTLRSRADPLDPIRPTSDAVRELAALGDTRPAVRTMDEALGFAELVSRAEAVAQLLRRRGTRPGDFVGVVADRSVHSISALFGAWLARCAYVPIDPGLPAERRRYMIDDAGLSIILGPAEFDCHGAELVDVRAVTAGPPGEPALPPLRTELTDVAYAIYTSGTTGMPKATLTTHANMLNFMAGLRETYGVRDWRDEVASLNAPLIFDVTVQQILALLGGATLAIVPGELRLDPDAMLDYVADTRITLLECIPPHLQLLVEAGLLTRPGLAVRRLVTGGEALPAPLWRPLAEARHLRVFNVYGPTECTVNSTCQVVDLDVERPVIGTELPGVSLFIADEQRRLVPYGAIGELYVAGAGVGLGYLGRPELTAASFLEMPWGPDGEPVRVYRTGDRVRLAKGGAVEYLGRLDNQVKIRGNRVELGEVTAKLLAHPAVRAAVTIVVDEGDVRGAALHSFVTVTEAGTSAAALTTHLRAFLPQYMVPSRIHELSAMPVTVIGKVDYRALELLARAEDERQPGRAEAPARPADDLEQSLAELWQEVLALPQVDPDAQFFLLGGHSLLAARLIARIRRRFDVAVTIGDLLGAPTPRMFAGRLPATERAPVARREHVIELADGGGDTPLVCPHPLGGDVFVYQDLVDALPPGRPVYGVFDGRTDVRGKTTWASAQEMIEAYAGEIVDVLDGRDCHLAGWSLGGLLAHAIAAELERRGVRVRTVSIWDSGVAEGERHRQAEPDWATGVLSVLASLAPAAEPALSAGRRAELRDRLHAAGDEHPGRWIARTAAALWPGTIAPEPDALAERAVTAALHNWLFIGWQPPVTDAPLYVTWAGDSLDRALVTRTDWRRYTTSAVHEGRVEGSHFSIINAPAVKLLAAGLTDAMAAPADRDGNR